MRDYRFERRGTYGTPYVSHRTAYVNPHDQLWLERQLDGLRRVVAEHSLSSLAFSPDGLPARALTLVRLSDLTTLGDVAALDAEALLKMRNVGMRTLRALTGRAHELAAQAASGSRSNPVPLVEPPASDLSAGFRWGGLPLPGPPAADDAPICLIGLPKRARDILEGEACTTVGDVLALDPASLLERRNIGRGTLEAIAAALVSAGPLESLDSAVDALPGPTSFVAIVDRWAGGLREVRRRVLVSRFLEHLTLQETAEGLGLSRERVRQIEGTLLDGARDACRGAGWEEASILDDGLIEFSELSEGEGAPPLFDARLYVTLARAVLLSARRLREIESFYASELDVLADDLADSIAALAGTLDASAIRRRAAELTPAVLELSDKMLVAEIRKRVGAPAFTGRPKVRSLVEAVVRQHRGSLSFVALQQRLGMLLAASGRPPLPDEVIRATVVRSDDLRLSDGGSLVELKRPPSASDLEWNERAVSFVLGQSRPASLKVFLAKHPDCSADERSLAELLNADSRVERVGRRLYASAAASRRGPIRVAEIVRRALRSEERAWTYDELLAHVRSRRDLISPQIDSYMNRIAGLIRYSKRCVGFVSIDRALMLQLLANETFVLDRLDGMARESATVEDLWLDAAGDDDRLSPDERGAIVNQADSWTQVTVHARDPLLFLRMA